jgi:peptidoglycan-N-acetylglucosamine deacetylase
MSFTAKQVALTFDDGPNGKYTLDILKILQDYCVKAAFFFPAKNVKRLPDIALKVKNQGHTIGSHAYDHWHLDLLSAGEILAQIEKAEEIFSSILDLKPRYFRPPYGAYNKTVEKILKKKGYRLILWDTDCYPKDWMDRSPQVIADISTARARDGSIILLHDGRGIRENVPRHNTVEALRIIIPVLKEKGFDIVTLDEICKG